MWALLQPWRHLGPRPLQSERLRGERQPSPIPRGCLDCGLLVGCLDCRLLVGCLDCRLFLGPLGGIPMTMWIWVHRSLRRAAVHSMGYRVWAAAPVALALVRFRRFLAFRFLPLRVALPRLLRWRWVCPLP